jgi:signal transduction histidine kinase
MRALFKNVATTADRPRRPATASIRERLVERLPSWPAISAYVRAVSPVVAFRGIALVVALIVISSDLNTNTNMEEDGWVLFVAAGHLALTAIVGQRLRAASARVNLLVIGVDIAICVAFVARMDGWRGPFWLYGVSAVFWPAYRFGLRGALLSTLAFDAGILLARTDNIRSTFHNGFGGDLVARVTMVFIVAGAVAFTARAMAQVESLAAEAERNRIARDLHDGVGKTLGGISLEASSLASWIERDPIEARRRARYLMRISERAANEVRDVIRSLRQQQSSAPLLPDVRRVVADWGQRHGAIAVQLQLNGPDVDVPVLIRLEVLRMLGELLDNVRRHARAEQVWVRLTLSTLGVTVAVRDDGAGFDTQLLDPWSDEGHFGLLGARERAWMLGGHFRLQSEPGRGTEVTIDLPLTPREERAPGVR